MDAGGGVGAAAVCLAGYAGGLFFAPFVMISPWVGVSLALLLLLPLLLFNTNPRLLLFLLLFFCVIVGLTRYPLRISPAASGNQLDSLVGQEASTFEGEVVAIHERSEGGLAVDILLRSSSALAGSVDGSRLRLLIGAAQRRPPVGSKVAFRSRIRRTYKFNIPGEFDYPRHLAYWDIWHTAYLENDRGLAVYAGTSGSVAARLGVIRQAGLSLIAKALDGDDAALEQALLLGEKGGLTRDLRAQLAAFGISHLFAISGLHLGLLALLLFALLKNIYRRSTVLLLWQPPTRLLWPSILPPLFCYLLLTGDALATRRAFYALAIILVLSLFRRRVAAMNLCLSLALLFLLIEPLALWQPSFVLSFSGVLGLLLWQSPLQRLFRGLPPLLRYPAHLLGASCAALVATMPATIIYFHLFAPAAIITNLFAIPLIGFLALPLGLFGLCLGIISPLSGAWLLQQSAWILQLVTTLAETVANIPLLSQRPVYLTSLETCGVVMACLALLAGGVKRSALLALVPALLMFYHVPAQTTAPELTVFSVGQGESMLLRMEGKTVLIDGGGLRSETFDVGERLLAPALGRLGVKSLDAMILTHNHPDHSGGLAFLLDVYPVREVWSSVAFEKLPDPLRQVLRHKDLPYHRYDDIWGKPGVAGLTHASLFVAPLINASENDRSLCLYVETPAGGLLLTGDLDAPGVASLMKTPPPGSVSLLKIPHHGSANSSPGALLDAFSPEIVVVSAGYKNTFKFPSEVLLRELEKQNIKIWRTDLDGTIRLRAGEGGWQVIR